MTTLHDLYRIQEHIIKIEKLARDLSATNIPFQSRPHYTQKIIDEILQIKAILNIVIGHDENELK